MSNVGRAAAAAAAGAIVLMAASCGGTAPKQARVAPAPPQSARARAPATAPRPHAVSWAVPATGITTPMPGEPDAAALDRARLQERTCEETKSDLASARVAEMRAAVEQAFEDWKSLPTCEVFARERELELQRERELMERGALSGSYAYDGPGDAMGGGNYAPRPMPSAAAGPPPPPTSKPSMLMDRRAPDARGVTHARSASGTNNQVEGVDEADIVKNDGAYVYVAANGALRIIEAMHPRLLSVTRMPGAVRELLVEGDRAVAFVSNGGAAQHGCTYAYDCAYAGDGFGTIVVVLDIHDREHPKIARRMDLSGSLMAARRIGSAVHVVVADGDAPPPSYETWPEIVPNECKVHGMDVAAVHARFQELARREEAKIRAQQSDGFPTMTENGQTRRLCDVMRPRVPDGQAFTTVMSFDMNDDAVKPRTTTIQSRPGPVFASEQALYFAVAHQGDGKEISEIHKLHLGPEPGDVRYVGSGTVPGHVLNQLSMDEWYGYLRVATSIGRVPDPNVESSVSVLAETAGGNLVRVGAVDHMAKHEDIRAVRFDRDRGYVVTFKKTDPLFVIDLGKPASPEVLGELKIPGFSTYIHRIDPEHLLSIGFDANDHGDFAYFDGVILQLFDVASPTDPKLLFKEKIGTRGSSSAAATDHLAFNYFADRGLLAVPMTECAGGGDGVNGSEVSFSGLLVYDVSVDEGFKKLGGVDHGGHGASCGTWWSNATSAVKRSIFLDDLVYSIADDRVKVQRLSRLGSDVADISMGE